MKKKYIDFLGKGLIQATCLISLLITGCIPKSEIVVSLKKNKITTKAQSVDVSNVQIINHQIIITGKNLNSVSSFKIKEGVINTNLQIESQNNTSIVANSVSNVTFAAGKIFDFILSNANGASTFTVDFSLCDSKLGGKGFNCLITPTDKQVLSYDLGTGKWRPRSVNGLNYQGTWSALTALPATGVLIPGDYYIVSVANAPYSVGDWIVLNQDGVTFEQVGNSAAVISVFGRNGNVVGAENDYVLDQLGDVDLSTPPTSGDALIFDGSHWVAGAAGGGGVPSGAAGGDLAGTYPNPTIGNNKITDTHIANNAISQTKINGLATSLSGKEPVITGAATTTYFRGDKTFVTLDTSVVPEGSRLYFTNARALGILLAGFDNTLTGQVAATDSMLQAFGRVQNQINSLSSGGSNYLVKNGADTISGTVSLTNVITASGAGDIVVSSVPLTMTSAVNKTYADGKLDKTTGGVVAGVVTLDNDLKIKSGANYVNIRGNAATAADYNFVLPANAGTAGYLLSTDGSGNTSWASSGMPENSQAVYRARVATTANITLSGTQTIDGVSLVAGDRVLVKNQSNDEGNGVYVVAAGAWSRAVDLNTWAEAIGYQVNISEGNSWAGMNFVSGAIASGVLETTGFGWSSIGNTLNTENTSNGYEALVSNTSGYQNIATGHYALVSNTTGYRNAASGYGTMMANTTGSRNTASGYQALRNNTTGADNTATGSNSLRSNVNGVYNTANGNEALYSNTSGSDNAAIGVYSLNANTIGNENVAVGNSSLTLNTIGNYNTAVGTTALRSNSGKNYSTAIGYSSMYYAHNTATNLDAYNTALGAFSLRGSSTASSNSGIQNTAIGASALRAVTTGSSNIGLGYNSGSAITSGSNNVVIGSNTGSTIATSSNNILLSDGAGTERARFNSSGYFGINQTVPGSEFDVKGILRLSGSTSGYVGFAPAAAAGSTTYTLPVADGSAGQLLKTNGAGVLSWVTDSTGSGFSGTASRAVATDGAGALTTVATTATELGYVNGVTSSIQTQLDAKQVSGNYVTALTGDVTATGPGSVAATVATVGGVTAANVAAGANLANAATNLNTASTIVKRDASGNFTAGTITATLNGTATNVSGTVAVANGGTGSTSLTLNRLLFGNGTSAIGTLATTATPSVLLSAVTTGAPTWTTSTTGNVLKGSVTGVEFGTLALSDLPAGTLSGSGTANYIPYYSAASTLANSPITVSGANIGIGTTSPQSNAHIHSGGGSAAIQFTDGTSGAASWSDGVRVSLGNSKDLNLTSNEANGNVNLTPGIGGYIIANGNVGIDMTPGTYNKLDVAGTIQGQGLQIKDPANLKSSNTMTNTIYGVDSAESIAWAIGDSDSSGQNLRVYGSSGYGLTFFSNASERMRIDSSGNVGIGTSSPGAKLDIEDPTENAHIRFSSSGTPRSYLSASGSSLFDIKDNGLTTKLTVTSSGNVGIGTTTPNYLALSGSSALTIAGDGSSSTAAGVLEVVNSIANGSIAAFDKVGAISFALPNNSGGANTKKMGEILMQTEGSGGANGYGSKMFFKTRADNSTLAATSRMVIDANGNVGIATSSPSYTLHVVGTAGLSTGTAWTNASDRRLKDIHGDYEYGLEEILKLHTVRYSYKKDNPLNLPSDFNKTGFIAQEVQKVIPDAVNVREDGYLELNVDPIHWAVVNSIKDLYKKYIMPLFESDKKQNREIASLKESNLKLQKENAEIKERLNRIEKMLSRKR